MLPELFSFVYAGNVLNADPVEHGFSYPRPAGYIGPYRLRYAARSHICKWCVRVL